MLGRAGDGKAQGPLNGEPGCPVLELATALPDSNFTAMIVVGAGECGALHTAMKADVRDSLAAAVPPTALLYARKGHSTISEVTDTPLLHRADVPEWGKSEGRTCFASTTAA